MPSTNKFFKESANFFWQKNFTPLSSHSQNKGYGSVVQLVRMPPCHGGGRGFESRPVRK